MILVFRGFKGDLGRDLRGKQFSHRSYKDRNLKKQVKESSPCLKPNLDTKNQPSCSKYHSYHLGGIQGVSSGPHCSYMSRNLKHKYRNLLHAQNLTQIQRISPPPQKIVVLVFRGFQEGEGVLFPPPNVSLQWKKSKI